MLYGDQATSMTHGTGCLTIKTWITPNPYENSRQGQVPQEGMLRCTLSPLVFMAQCFS